MAGRSLLWRPGRIGPMELKNRVIRSATNEHLSEANGQLTTAWMDALVELAEHEVGLVITGHMSVDGQQRSDQGADGFGCADGSRAAP